MDSVRDIERKDTVSRFFSDKPLRTQAFGANTSAELVYRKAERIAAGIHLLTNHVPTHEPARGACRQAGIELLDAILASRDEMRASNSEHVLRVHALIRKLISLARFLSSAGHISVQNAEIITDALDELGVLVVSAQRSSLSESVALTREDFSEVSALSAPADTRAHADKRHTVQTSVRVKDKSGASAAREVAAEKTGVRAERIAGVLASRGTLAIKDITAHVPEYSEKMVQRELKDLVSLGRVKKTGSKRWSTYSLAR